VTVLAFEAPAGVSSLSTTTSTPLACQTGAYVAGSNETAIISLDAMVRTTGSATSVFLAPMATANGSAPSFLVSFFAITGVTTNVYASLHTQAAVNLVEGVSYRFATGLRAAATMTVAELVCRGLVTIVRHP